MFLLQPRLWNRVINASSDARGARRSLERAAHRDVGHGVHTARGTAACAVGRQTPRRRVSRRRFRRFERARVRQVSVIFVFDSDTKSIMRKTTRVAAGAARGRRRTFAIAASAEPQS